MLNPFFFPSRRLRFSTAQAMIGRSTCQLLLRVTVFLLSLTPALPASDSLNPGASINATQTLVSPGGTFALGFFNPGGTNYYLGIWYNKIPGKVVVWVANRERPISGRAAPMLLTLTDSGNLVITIRGLTLWSAGVGNSSNHVARLTDDGNFGLMDRSSRVYAWQSFEHPTDTILPDMKVMVNRRTGNGTVLRSWRSATDPAPGDYTYAVEMRGYPQITFYYKSDPLWRSGPLVGWYWSEAPASGEGNSTFNFVSTEDTTYYYMKTDNNSTLMRIVVNQTAGLVQMWESTGGGGWKFSGDSPEGRCERYGACGAYGICAADRCECVKGFVPRTPGNWSAGCVRRMTLDCRQEKTTDSFVLVSGVKMPDSLAPREAETKTGWGAGSRCKDTCRKNCSCTAYSQGPDGASCILWLDDLMDLGAPEMGEQDLFVRVAAADAVFKRSNARLRKQFTFAGIVVGAFLAGALLLGSAGYLIRRRRRKATKRENCALADSDLPLLDLATVSAATNNFSEQNVLGEGGFGTVFKGKLEDGQEVAVKRLSCDSKQGLDEFKTEVVLIAKLQHKNLVRLLGCCIHENERMLVYEYMHNKSLDHFLFDKTKSSLLDWPTRYQIILGVAKGLMYLHHDSRLTIIHRDMKTSNVLLDAHMDPKISDFGMARIFARDQGQAKTNRVVGTYGYMSPEYALDGIFSVKSDVFSFGVVALEIVSGLKSKAVFLADPRDNLLGYAWDLWNENKILELLDPTVSSSVSIPEALTCIQVGLLCVQQRAEDRPMMSTVISMLGNANEALPVPKPPGFVNLTNVVKTDPILRCNEDKYSTNDASITVMHGR